MPERLNQPIVDLACYEPSGYRFQLREPELVRHILVAGSTGCGKTTLIEGMLGCLLRHRAQEPEQRIGLLVTDAKVDGAVERLRRLAWEAGREMVVLGPEGTHALDFFKDLRSLDDVDAMVRKLEVGTGHLGQENAYWEEARRTMLDAALTLLAVGKGPVRFGKAMEFLRTFYFTPYPWRGTVSQLLERAEGILKRGSATPAALGKIAQALDTARNWQSLDSRTLGITRTVLMNALQPFLSSLASRCLDASQRPCFEPESVLRDGVVCAVSCNALAEPALASFLFRLCKEDFFRGVHRRGQSPGRLVGFVADEYPLTIQASDAEQLATIRSRRAFFLAATQGLGMLGVRESARRAILLNLCTVVAMQSREEELEMFCHRNLGTRVQAPRRRTEEAFGNLLEMFKEEEKVVPVCPLGTLGRLETHQAYVLMSSGPLEHPVWFAPRYVEGLKEEINKPGPSQPASQVFEVSEEEPVLSLKVLLAALEVCEPAEDRARVLEEAQAYFLGVGGAVPEGLEELPGCWLKGLPKILKSLRLIFRIASARVEDGVLQLRFEAQRFGSWDRAQKRINRALYPNRWRPLLRRHALALRACRPELRAELGDPPGAGG